MSDSENLKTGDRVRHADTGTATGVITGFPWYPLATVRWDSTGNESTENMYLLVRVS